MKKIVVAFLALLFGCANFYAQVGTLDSSFGNGGIATSPFMSYGDDVAKDVKIQSDGKIVVGGYCTTSNGNDFLIARYLPTGNLDTSFGNNGFVKIDISGNNDELEKIFIDNNGKIVAIGRGLSSFYKIVVVRLNVDGTLDNTFGTNGIYFTQLGSFENYLTQIDQQSNGNYIIAGVNKVNIYGYYPKIFRLNTNGTFDSTFGSSGFANLTVYNPVSTQTPFYFDLKVMEDDRILCSSTYIMGGKLGLELFSSNGSLLSSTHLTNIDNSLRQKIGIQTDGNIIISSCYQSDSYLLKPLLIGNNLSIDTSYGNSGYVVLNRLIDELNGISMLPNNNMISVGNKGNDLVLFNTDSTGNLDTDFNYTGNISFNLGNTIDQGAAAAYFDNKLIVVGTTTNSSGSDILLLKYNMDGTIDTSFGSDGIVVSNFSGSAEIGKKHVVLSNGKIVMGFESSYGNINLMGFNVDGSLDSSFGTNGIVSTEISSNQKPSFTTVLLDGTEKIWGVGNYNNNCVMVKYNTDGSLDTSFDADGLKVYTNNFVSRSAMIQPDGKIVIGGAINNVASLMRINQDGNLDTTFGTNGVVQNTSYINIRLIKMDGLSNIFILTNSNSILKYNSSGILDTTFNNATGIVGVTISSSIISDNLFDITQDNKILYLYRNSYDNYYQIWKRSNNGTYETFSSNGNSYTSINYDAASLNNVMINVGQDGAFYITANKINQPNVDLLIAKKNSNGTSDTAFGSNGFSIIDYNANYNTGNFASVEQDYILVSGTLKQSLSHDVALYKINLTNTVSVNDLLKASTKVFPNPFTDYLNIESDRGAIDTVTIYDTKGSLCGTYNNNQIDLSHLKAGMYFVKITQNDKSFVAKVFKN